MQEINNCPRCGNRFSAKHHVGQGLVCECGWSFSNYSAKVDSLQNDQTAAIIVLVAALLIAGIFHVVNWDRHLFSIMPLKIKQWTHKASISDYDKLAQICEERKKSTCVEEAYTQIEKLDPRNLANLSRLGQLQAKSERWHHAARTLSKYFQLLGRDTDTAYAYAKVLTELKKFPEAERYFKFVLQQRPRVLQVSVVRSYVQMLMTANRLTHAKELILTHRRKSASASLFMNKELDEIRLKLSDVKISASANKKISAN